MTQWHYAIGKQDNHYKLVEVFIDTDSPSLKRTGWTSEDLPAYGESPEELIEVLTQMLEDAKRYPMIDVETGAELTT